MNIYTVSNLAGATLRRELSTVSADNRSSTALQLAYIAEFDARRSYLEDGYSSMHSYCVSVLLMSEDSARKRIHAGRVARRFPVLFEAVADGSLNLTAIIVMAPHLGEANAAELIAAARHHSRNEIEHLLASWFPRFDVPTQLVPVPASQTVETLSEQRAPGRVSLSTTELAAPAPPARVAPLAPERFALQCTLPQATHDKLRYLQSLLSHTIPSGDIPAVLDQAFDAAIAQFEKRKFAATRHIKASRATRSRRHIPAHVKEIVWRRDEGRCTFAAESGHRCESRHRHEFDHVPEVARGGEATVDNLRLRCRAHNQYGAECTFGAGFMAEKREAARQLHDVRSGMQHEFSVAVERPPSAPDPELDVTPWLRQLGFRAEEARAAAVYCATLAGTSLEQRVRAGISYLRPKRASQALARVTTPARVPAGSPAPPASAP